MRKETNKRGKNPRLYLIQRETVPMFRTTTHPVLGIQQEKREDGGQSVIIRHKKLPLELRNVHP